MKNTKLQTVLLCLVCTFFWGTGYPVVKLSCAYFGIQPLDVPGKLLHAGCRFMLLLGVSWVRGKRPAFPNRQTLPAVLRLSLCQTVLQYGLLYVGLANTSGTKGSVLNQINVFLLVLLTPLFFKKERLTKQKLLGCVVGFAGIVVMNLSGLHFSIEWGDLVVVLSSCFAAAGYLLAKAMPSACDHCNHRLAAAAGRRNAAGDRAALRRPAAGMERPGRGHVSVSGGVRGGGVQPVVLSAAAQ